MPTSRIFWLLQSLADVPNGDDWLSSNERVFQARLRFPKRRNEWRLGRWTAKSIVQRAITLDDSLLRGECQGGGPLAGLIGATEERLEAWPQSGVSMSSAYHRSYPPLGGFQLSGWAFTPRRFPDALLSRIEIRPAPDGAPEAFMDDQPLPITLSISHREEIGFCAISPSGTPVGCDVEIIEPRSETFVADYFTQQEQEVVKRAAGAERSLLVMLIWSTKESALKALRQGLRVDTRWVEVELPSHAGENGASGEWHPLSVRYLHEGQTFQGWWRQEGTVVQTVVVDEAYEKLRM